MVSITCGLLILITFFAYCQNEKALESDKDSKYILNDDGIMDAVRSGISMDEINFLIYISRRADKSVLDLIELKKNGLSIHEIDEQFPYIYEESEVDEDSFVILDKTITNYKISDFRTISYGMTIEQVTTILNGRTPNRYLVSDAQISAEVYVHVYELVTGGEIWITYLSGVTSMTYKNSENSDESFDLIKELDEYDGALNYDLY